MLAAVEINNFCLAFDQYVTNYQLLHGTRPAAITTYATARRYEQFAFQLSALGTYQLIWIMHGSPLAIQPLRGNCTLADEHFQDYKCERLKLRLVIFRTNHELDEYILARNEYTQARKEGREIIEKNALRCEAFENACAVKGTNPGQLLFSSSYFIDKFSSYDSDVLDIGAIKPDKDGPVYCFQSPFVSANLSERKDKRNKKDHFEEIKFFPLHNKCEGVDDDAILHYVGFLDELLECEKFDDLDWVFSDPTDLKNQIGERPVRFNWLRSRIGRFIKSTLRILWPKQATFLLNIAHLCTIFLAFLVLLTFMILTLVDIFHLQHYIQEHFCASCIQDGNRGKLG